MGKIILMEHHLDAVKYYRDINESDHKFTRWLHDKTYNEGFFNKVSQWAKSLDPENTLVEIIPDFNLHRGMNLDDICNLGCSYIKNCEESPKKNLLEVLKRKPLIFPVYFFGGLYNHFKKKPYEKGFYPHQEYPLKIILEKI